MRSLSRLFTRRPRKPEPGPRPYTDRVVLAEQDEGEHHALTPIAYPDGLTPIGHSLPRLDPHAVDLHQTVSDAAHRLCVENSIDEFTMDALDNWISSWHQTWIAGVKSDAEARRRTAARLVAVCRENLVRETAELDNLRAEQTAVETDHSAFCAALGLSPRVKPTSTQNPDEAVLPSSSTSMLFDLLMPTRALPESVTESKPIVADPAATPEETP